MVIEWAIQFAEKKIEINPASQPSQPAVALAQEGRLILDRDQRRVDILLRDAASYVPGTEEGVYDTERAVFGLRNGSLTLLEIAPGIDIRRHVLDLMPEGVQVADDLITMDRSIFEAPPAVHAA